MTVRANEVVAKHLHFGFTDEQCDTVDTGFFNLFRSVARNDLALRGQQLTIFGDDVFRAFISFNAVCNGKLLIVFITTNPCEVISSRVKEQRIDQHPRAFHCGRLARTQTPVDFDEAVLNALSAVLFKCGLQKVLIAEKIDNLLVCSAAHCAHQHRHGQLARSVHAHPVTIV